MSNLQFNIKRWDAVLSKCGSKMPMIYIEPTIEFLELVKKNNNYINATINNTSSVYDTKTYNASVIESSFVPNFFDKTRLYILILNTDWVGYPGELGNVVLSDFF
jgi:hypothetical protein